MEIDEKEKSNLPKGQDTKFCFGCKTLKSLSDFNKNRIRSDGVQTYCRECMSVRATAYYQRRGKQMRKQSNSAYKKRKTRNKEWLRSYLEERNCVDCGSTDVRVLEFDHVSGEKEGAISRLVNDGYSIKRLKSEIAKCEVVCANCHRIRTYERDGGNWRTK